MSFAVEPVLDEKCTVSAHRSVSGRREERDATRDDEFECDGPAACWQLTGEDIDAAMATITDDIVAPDGGRPSPTAPRELANSQSAVASSSSGGRFRPRKRRGSVSSHSSASPAP